MTTSFRLGTWALLCALVLAGSVNGQSRVQHKVHHYDLSSATDKASKSQTMDPTFTGDVPLGLPRNGVSFQIDYNIWFVVDNATENIDYFAFHAPSGWTITAIGAAPSQSACQDDPHTSVVSGFSATSAYWGGDSHPARRPRILTSTIGRDADRSTRPPTRRRPMEPDFSTHSASR